MSKLYKLKDRYSFEDAALRLQSVLGEKVTVNDVLQLIAEGHLFMSWYIRDLFGQGVKLETFRKCPYYMAESGYVGYLNQYSARKKRVDILNGPYRIIIERSEALKDYLFSLITGQKVSDRVVDAVLVGNLNDEYWEIMYPLSPEEIEEEVGSAAQYLSIRSAVFYTRSYDLPDLNELGIERVELERFEASLESGENKAKALNGKERASLINIIGVLLGTLLGKSSNGTPYSAFSSQEAIIDSIHANYGEGKGLSKRNLEEKFAEANRVVKSSFGAP